MSLRISLYSVLLIFLLTGCQQEPTVLDEILSTRTLKVATRYAPTTIYELHDEKTGLEYDMLESFAHSIDVKIEYLIKDSTAEILSAVESGDAHIAAAGLTRTQGRKEKFIFGPVYQQVQQQVVCRRGGANPKNIEQLLETKFLVPEGTSYAETLAKHAKDKKAPEYIIKEEDTESLLEMVWRKKIDCTVADSNIVAINRRYYPELKVRFSLTDPQSIAWVMSEQADDLQTNIEDWFENYMDTGELDATLEKYYGYIELFDYVDTRKFKKRIKTRLPKYKKEFKDAAKKYELDWSLLAAQSYQESHWNPRAKSPTGVRGMMMLTLNTAKSVGVKSRLDPVQSIHGGAKYFAKLEKRVPDSITGIDRTWFALAAYNVGMGHVYDARTLTRKMGKNPDIWRDVAEVFPLLSKKKYYRKLKYGYARGTEPVIYVQRIRDYHDMLLKSMNLVTTK